MKREENENLYGRWRLECRRERSNVRKKALSLGKWNRFCFFLLQLCCGSYHGAAEKEKAMRGSLILAIF